VLGLRLAVVADAANISREGKLNITGIFNSINAHSFPATHPWMVLAFVIDGDARDAIPEHALKVDLIDSDGSHVLPSIEGKLSFGQMPSGGSLYVPQIIQLSGVKFMKACRHEFKIVIDGEVRGSVPIDVKQVETPSTK